MADEPTPEQNAPFSSVTFLLHLPQGNPGRNLEAQQENDHRLLRCVFVTPSEGGDVSEQTIETVTPKKNRCRPTRQQRDNLQTSDRCKQKIR